MSLKNIKDNKFIKIYDENNTVIFEEKSPKTVSYNPRNDIDLKKIIKASNIEEFIKESKYHHNLFIFKNKKYNLGVYTTNKIKKNQIICEYLGDIASLDKEIHPRKVASTLKKKNIININTAKEKIKEAVNIEIKKITHYAFALKENTDIDDTVLAHNKRSIAGFINHNSTDFNIT
ncbi:hypothetical protein N9L02_03640, partial [Gammaproteobacteria bacterium]|nr:hypothetical protein [Gammaproteobacteria bacterium]